MKPFNLEKALQGKPVQLRNGCKAIIFYRVPDVHLYDDGTTILFPLKGISFNPDGSVKNSNCSWKDDGAYTENYACDSDIIGMWEEPTPTITLTLPKPFKPKQDEIYYSISDLYIKPEKNVARCLTAASIKIGNCFRKEEDAQAWIDAMRDAVYE